MKNLIFAFIMLLPLPAWAELKLSDLVGNWGGQGTYAEGLSSAKLRCKLVIAGTDAMVRMTGRCGSSLGAENLALDFVKGADSTITVDSSAGAPQSDSPVGALRGSSQGNQLIIRGEGGDETVTIELILNPDGSLRFATQRTWPGKTGTSVVTLKRR